MLAAGRSIVVVKRERAVAVVAACLLTNLDLVHQKQPRSIDSVEVDCWTAKGIP